MHTTAHTSSGRSARGLAALAIAAAVLAGGLAGCRGERSDKRPRQFLPDMDDSPKWKPQVKSEFFEDSRTLRPKVEGTVAFGQTERLDERSRAPYLKGDDAFYNGISGYDTAGEPVFVDTIPLAGFALWPVSAGEGEAPTDFLARREGFMGELIRRGQERFNIYCSVCHGLTGDGQGMVGKRWTSPVANLHDPKYSDPSTNLGKDGYLFNVLRHGVPFPNTKNEALRMPAYGHSVTEEDAWAIISYIRTLQASRTGIENVPPAERERLRSVPQPKPAATPGTTPPAPGAPANGGSAQ